MDDERLCDGNFSSTLLEKQLEGIKEKQEIRDVTHESTETEILIPCLLEAYDPENAGVQFWRFTAEELAGELDKLREENLNLENSINDRKTELNELRNLNAELLEKAQYLDNSTNETRSETHFSVL